MKPEETNPARSAALGREAASSQVSGLKSQVSLLEAEADRIAALRADPRTPSVVRRAFLRPGAITLRKFLALEDAASPVLDGKWPFEDPAAMAEAFCTAFAIVFPGEPIPEASELSRAIDRMVADVRRGFSTVMPMRWPRNGADSASRQDDGLGWVARFIARFSYLPETTLDIPMDQLFILAAAQSANEGADCAGEDYRERTLPECEMRNGECEMPEGSAAGNADILDPVPKQGKHDDLGQEEDDGPRTQGKQGVEEIPSCHTQNDTSSHG